MRKSTMWVSVGAAVITGIGALVPLGGPAGAAGKSSPIDVGMLAPTSGVFASNGKDEIDGFKLGLKTFGSKIDGHKINATYENTQGQATVALSDAKQLVTEDHVKVVEGPLVSSAIAAVAPYVLSKGVPEDDLYLASPQQVQDYKSFGMGFDSTWDGYAGPSEGALWAYKTMGWRHMSTIGINISFGWQGIGAFEAEFKKLGGTITTSIWVPLSAVTLSTYVSEVPSSTQGVFGLLSGAQAASFVNQYQSYGLKSKIPLMGNTTLTDQAALPAEKNAAAVGIYTASHYCTALSTATNKKFVKAYHKAYTLYPSYYSEAGYTKAEILVKALKSLHGKVTSEKALAKAMRKVKIDAPRGPVTINKSVWAPTENEYVCKVETVNGSMRNVPIKTFKNVPPWGVLKQSTFKTSFAAQSSGPPS